MRAFLTKIEDFFASVFSRIGRVFDRKKADTEAPPKKPGLFDRLDAVLARYDGSFLIWSFFLSAAVLLLTYVAIGVYPFGESSVLVLDLNGQYVQFFAGLRALLHGDGSLFYSFSRSLGGEFLGIYTYYLASPLSFIVALFPEKNILEALLVMFVLKGGIAGLSFGAFLHYTRRPPKTLTVGLSVLYALSSYVVVMQHNTMWIDGLMLLPLLILGLERLIKHRKPILYTVTLAVILLANYYIGYMICIFTAMYFFYYFLSKTGEEIDPRGEKHYFWASLLRVGVFTAIALAIAALLLLPAYYSLTFGKTDFSTGDFSFRTKFDIIDFLAKLFPGAYDTVRPEGLPWVYSGVLALILLPLYFIAGKIPTREKIASGGLLFLLFVSMYINTLDVLWHGGQAPNWLNYRYSFLFIFVVLLLSARAVTALRSVPPTAILAVCGTLFLLTVVLQKLGLAYTANGETREFFDDLSGVWLTIGCLLIYGFLLLLLSGHEEKAPRFEVIAMLLVGVISLETLLNGVFYLRRQHEDVVISSYDSYHGFYDVYDDAFDHVKETDDSPFFRMDKTFQRTVCDSFVIGYKGLASSTSTLNASVVKLQHQLGMKANSHWTEATGSTVVTNSFLGVKYWVAKQGETVDPLYTEYHKTGEGDTATVTYKNPYALPLIFASAGLRELSLALPRDQVDYHYDDLTKTWVLNEEWDGTLWSPFTRMNAIYAALCGDDTLSVYDPIPTTVTTKGGMDKEGITWSHAVYKCLSGNASARIVFTLKAPSDGSPVYCYFPTKYSREAQLYVNGERFGDVTFYPGHANIASVVSLGSFEAGETITVELSLGEGNEFYLVADTPYFCTVDEADLARATEILSRGGLTMSRADDDHFLGTLTAAEGFTSVQTTIPYDKGWRIYVNGEPTEGYVSADALLAFDLPEAGTYEIELLYRPAIYTVGLFTSIGGALLLAAVITLIVLRQKGVLVLKNSNRFHRAVSFLLPDVKAAAAPTETAVPPVPGKRISGEKPKSAGKGKRKK